MVFQAALSGTNYFKRPPLYHNRIKKYQPNQWHSKTLDSGINYWTEDFSLSWQSVTQIYLFWKSHFALKSTLLAENTATPPFSDFTSHCGTAPWRNTWKGLDQKIKQKNPQAALTAVLVEQKCSWWWIGLEMNREVNCFTNGVFRFV